MMEPSDFEALIAAFDRTDVWYRELSEEQTLTLALGLAGAAPTEPRPVRGLELAGGDVMFFGAGGAYLGNGSWTVSPTAFFARGEEEPSLAPLSKKVPDIGRHAREAQVTRRRQER